MKKQSAIGMATLLLLSAVININAQNLFVASGENGLIYEYTPEGVRTVFASGLASPMGLAFDSACNLFVANGANGAIYKYAPDGTMSIFAQELIGGGLSGLACNSVDEVFMANWDGWLGIYKYTPDGTRSIFATELSFPYGLTFDSNGNLFVASAGNGHVYKYTPDGTRSIFVSNLGSPSGITFDGRGNLFVGEYIRGIILKITPDGTQSIFASGLHDVIGLTFNDAGNLFAVSRGDNSIYKYTPDGIRSTFATGLLQPSFLVFKPTIVIPSPVITLQPKSQTVGIGSTVRFSVKATNTPPQMTYQWYFGTSTIVGATDSTLVLMNVQSSQSGSYTVTVTGVNGSVTSDPATLSVLPRIGVSMIPRVEVNGEIGLNYRIEFVNVIGPTDAWQPLITLTVTNNPQFYHDDSAVGQSLRFYRLVHAP